MPASHKADNDIIFVSKVKIVFNNLPFGVYSVITRRINIYVCMYEKECTNKLNTPSNKRTKCTLIIWSDIFSGLLFWNESATAPQLWQYFALSKTLVPQVWQKLTADVKKKIEKMAAAKTVRRVSRGELVHSTLLGKCVRISLNFLRKCLISTEGSLSFAGKKVVIVSTEELHFYGMDTPLY